MNLSLEAMCSGGVNARDDVYSLIELLRAIRLRTSRWQLCVKHGEESVFITDRPDVAVLTWFHTHMGCNYVSLVELANATWGIEHVDQVIEQWRAL